MVGMVGMASMAGMAGMATSQVSVAMVIGMAGGVTIRMANGMAIGSVVGTAVDNPRGFERQEGAPVRANSGVLTRTRTSVAGDGESARTGAMRTIEGDREPPPAGALMIMDYHFRRNLRESIE